MIRINEQVAIRDDEVTETFVRARGPGGQNVNKVSSAVQLRFRARGSPSLAPDVAARLERIAGARLTRDGEIVITAGRFRTQAANRRDARARLARMIDEASRPPAPRVPTRPRRTAVRRRLEDKARRSRIKRLRAERIHPDD